MADSSGSVENGSFDVVVIGAGINGAGIARDAAMRGLRVLLLDKGDLASGTSSFSTRLIHGGLRYLEHGELGLVRESLRERKILLRIAPHLVRPLALLIPIYENRRRGRLAIRAGLLAYDLFSHDKSLTGHRLMSRAEALREQPGLNPTGLIGAAVYHDAQVEFAERLVLENVLAARDHKASIRTYEKVTAFRIVNGRISGVEIVNQMSGAQTSVSASLVVNAAGPWVDDVLKKTGCVSERQIGGTKGSHIVVAPFSGSPSSALYVEAESDGRPFFVIPWNGNLLIGTTDMRFEGNLDAVVIDDVETNYLLNETNRLFPRAGLRRESILFSYAGVRPLPFASNVRERSITRRHFIRERKDLPGVLSIVGGKLTTYRALAEETVDLLFKKLGKTVTHSRTANELLPGARVDIATARNQLEVLPELVRQRLLRVYGARAVEVSNLVRADSSLAETVDKESGAIAAEVVFAFKHEMAQTLSDCLLRRMMIGWSLASGLTVAEAAVRVGPMHLGWSKARAAQEIDNYKRSLVRFQLVMNSDQRG